MVVLNEASVTAVNSDVYHVNTMHHEVRSVFLGAEPQRSWIKTQLHTLIKVTLSYNLEKIIALSELSELSQ